MRRPAIRTLHGWAISVLKDAGAVRACEEHGGMRDRFDPHARERAFEIAHEYPPDGICAQAAAVAIAEVLDSIGDHLSGVPTAGWMTGTESADPSRGGGRE
jgi:hypothetical protein